MDSVSIKNIRVFPFQSDSDILDFIEKNKGILVAINAEKILKATERTKDIINRNIGYIDGVGALLAVRKKGYKNACKIPGCELWLKIVEHFYHKSSFYLVGGKQEIIEKTITKLNEEYPGINIVGFHNGYLTTPEIHQSVIDDIVEKKPDIVFVAMGSPKQELFMEEIQRQHNAIFQGLGGSFDVYTGYVERAPRWWIKHNLEFAYRLFKQPKRIKRQIHLIKFLWLLTFNKV